MTDDYAQALQDTMEQCSARECAVLSRRITARSGRQFLTRPEIDQAFELLRPPAERGRS